jgi:hypothetical protein
LVEVSVNATASGFTPDVVLVVNDATGGDVTFTHVVCVERLNPAAFPAPREIEKLPVVNFAVTFCDVLQFTI